MDNQQEHLAAGLLTALASSIVAAPTSIPSALTSTNHSLPILTSDPGYDDGGEGRGRMSEWSSLIGIITALVGNVLISLALNIQRYAHIRIDREFELEQLRNGSCWRRSNSARDLQDSYGSLEEDGLEQEGRGRGSRSPQFGRYRDESPDVGPEYEEYRDRGISNDRLQRSLMSDQTVRQGDKLSGGRKSYLRSPYWWVGIVLMCVGETGNFMAYGFAPASIVSPLGVVALISNCVIAPFMLKEQFRKRDFWGVLVAIAGAVVVVLSAKSSEEKIGPHDIWVMITRWEFELYLGLTAALIVALMWASGKYGSQTILIDVGLVALFGGYTALSTKGVSSLLSFTWWHVITFPVTYLLVFVLVGSALAQVRYINRALQRFDSTQVIPTQFVLFTLSVIIGSAILYHDFESFSAERAGKFVGGCAMTFLGVYFITSGRVRSDDESSFSTDDEEEAIGLLRDERYRDTVDLSPPGQQYRVNKPAQKTHEPEELLQSPSGSLLSHGMEGIDEDQPTPKGVLSPSSPGGSLTEASLSEPSPDLSSPLHSQSLITNPWADTPTPLIQATTSEPQIRRPATPPAQSGQTPPASTVALRFPAAPGIGESPVRNGKTTDGSQAPAGEGDCRNHFRTLSVPQTPPAAGNLRNSISMRFSPGPLLPALSGGFSAVVAESLRRGEASPAKERKHRRKDSRRKRSNSAAVDEILRGRDGAAIETEYETEASVDDARHTPARLATARLNSTGDIATAPATTGYATPAVSSEHSGVNDAEESTALTRLRSLSDSWHGGLAWLSGSLRKPSSKTRKSVLGVQGTGTDQDVEGRGEEES